MFNYKNFAKRSSSPAGRNNHTQGAYCRVRGRQSAPFENSRPLNWRLYFIFIFMLGGVLIILFRLIMLQVWDYNELVAKAKDQHLSFETLQAKRGQIFMRDGEDNTIPVATNEDMDMVVIAPKYIEDIEGTIQTLATVLNMDTEEIRKKVMKREDVYEVIKRKLSREESSALAEKKLAGVELVPESWRYYPEGELASQILGFIGYKEDNHKRVGQSGIEAYFNDILEGESGFVKAERDTIGRWISISQRTMERPEQGTDIVLTLDQSVQYFVEKTLKEAVEKYEADSGTIIVMNPQNGQILAMANFPTFNNNDFSDVEDMGVFRNRAISDQYEPGSSFKPINASMGIDLGKLTPDSTYVDTGVFSIAGYNIHNSDGKAYGEITLTRFLELSLNTGAIWAMQTTGKENFLKYIKDYGFGQETGVELLGEADGDIANLDYMRDINYVTASFGQGISVTPLQLITAFSAVVNGGKLMKPQIVDRFIYDDGKEEIVEPKEVRQVINSKTSAKMRAMLISVVKNGWGKKAGVPGYLVGGKTGTAQVPDPNGGYSDQMIHNFVGFGPGSNPQFVTLVKLDNVKAVNFASDSVTVVTGKLNKFLLDHYNIFPTEEIKEEEQAYFNRLMELKEEDIQKAKENTTDGAEGAVIKTDEEEKKDSKKDKKKKDKD